MDVERAATIASLLRSEEALHLPVFGTDSGFAAPSDDAGAAVARSEPSGPPPDLDLHDDQQLLAAIKTRVHAVSFAIHNTVARQRDPVLAGIAQLEQWVAHHEIVRVIGAGRALHAASIPANRLAHAGAAVHMLNDVMPLPNSHRGGGILAASASGRTEAVLGIMRTARKRNPDIRIMGVAARDAEEFASLCDIFIGIEEADNPYRNPLSALADTGEYVISELLDAMVVAAAKRLGLTDADFRLAHEDLGPTGPYQPESPVEHE